MNKKNEQKCIICGDDNLKKYKAKISPFLVERMFDNKKNETEVLLCKNCHLNFFALRPSDEEMQKLYKDYRGEEYQKQRQKFEAGYTLEFNNYLGHNLEELSRRKKYTTDIFKNNLDVSSIKTVLDFGGDEGQFIPEILQYAERFVYEISGVTPIDGIKCIGNEKELETYNWDLIMCCHVLEHVSYPMELLTKIINLMKSGSYLYLELPIDKIEKSPLKEFIRRPKRLAEVISSGTMLVIPQMHEHINFFNIKTLEYIFNNSEYEVLDKHDETYLSVLVKKI